MADPKIPLSDLPAGVPGAFDKVAGVDTATGASRLFPLPQAGVPRSYATRASLPAASGFTEGYTVWVNNDPTPANNGTWAVQGGAWVQSADRVTGLEGRVAAVESKVAATGMSYPTPSAINLDLDAGFLRITGAQVRVFYGRSSQLIPAQDVAIPGSRQRVELNTSTGVVSFSSAASVPATNIVLGSYDHQERKLVGFPPHFVNGVLLRTPSFGRTVVSAPDVITFDIAARQLTMTSCRIVTPQFSANVTATVPFPANGSAPYRLEWTPGAASPVSFVASSATLDPKKIVFGIVRIQSSSVDVYGIDQYQVTGGSQPLSIYQGTLTGQPQYINFDFGAGFLRITTAGQIRAQYGRSVPTVPVQDVALPVALSTTWHKLLFNVDTRELSFLESYNALQPANTIIVGMVRVASQQVVGLLDYYVNGQPRSSGGGAALADREWIAVTGPTEPAFVVSPPLPDFKWVTSSPDYTAVYALYDALVAAYPGYVSRTLLGPDDAGNPIYRYDFTPPSVPTGAPRIAKMILMAGIHGGERGGTMALCFAMQQICNKWQTEPLLETLRWNCHFIVIPVASPWGFNNNGRKNENGVDIARNFPTLWSAGSSDPSSQQYRGPFPLSEKPAQYIDAIMYANRDAIYCGSFHNFSDPGPNNNFIWNASGTTFGMRISQALISKLSRAWKARYSWMPQNHTTYLGYADLTTPVGSEGRHATTAYDIQGGTFEICGTLPLAPDPGQYSSEVATLGAETIVNWLLVNLEHGSALYNGRGA